MQGNDSTDVGSELGVPLPGTPLSSLWRLPAQSVQQRKTGERAQQVSIIIGTKRVAFDDIYLRYYARVLAYLRFRVGSNEAAEDLVSLVFERALTHLRDLQSPGSLGAWLFRIARNCAVDYFRRQRPATSLDILVDASHPRECSPEELMVAREERQRLLTLLGRLPEREREVIGLKFVACLQNREIARVLNMPEGTVSSLLYRSLARLRDALNGEEER